MARLREIRKRIKAVANIQRITKTMQMIATSKFQGAVRRANATKPFTAKIGEIANELASAAGGDEMDHPLLHPPAHSPKRELVLVLTSNRGLCGAYNSSVLRTATAHLRTLPAAPELQVVGRKGVAFFRFAALPVSKTYIQFTDKLRYADIEQIADELITRFTAGEFDAVRVIYMQFISNSKQVARVAQLLPLEKPAETAVAKAAVGIQAVYEFSPEPAEILGKLLPLTVKTQLFQFFNDAVVSEQISRMVAMKSATDNAGKIVKALRRQFNRARQAQITKELIEIVSGAAALK